MNHNMIEQEIESAYHRFGFSEGWRLWYHPKAWVEQPGPLVLGINPASGGDWASHGRYSQEAGSAFKVENWGQRSLVQDPVPQYLRLAGLDITKVSYANWVPFRTPSTQLLTENRARWKEIRQWCKGLWGALLQETKPRLILCIGSIPRDEIKRVLEAPTRQCEKQAKNKSGFVATFRNDYYEKRGLQVVSLPYPSTRLRPLEDPFLRPVLNSYLGEIAAMVT